MMDGQQFDALCAGLAHSLRRRTCRYLAEKSTRGATVDELVASLTESQDPSWSADSESGPSDLRLALHHVHLPKLDDADVVEYDPDRQRVERGDWLSAAVDLLGKSPGSGDVTTRNRQ